MYLQNRENSTAKGKTKTVQQTKKKRDKDLTNRKQQNTHHASLKAHTRFAYIKLRNANP